MRTPDTEKREQGTLPAALSAWLKQATDQMRWQRARPMAEKELSDHLTDQYEAFLEEGMDEDAAAQATAREMGDAVETGTQLDRAWRPQPDWVMLGIVLVVAAAGLVLQYNMRPHNDLEWYMFFGKYVAGAVCLLVAYFADYTILGRHCWLLYGVWVVIGLLLAFGSVRGESMGKLVYLAQWVWFFPVLFAGILFRQRGKGTRGIGICLLSLPAMWFLAIHAPSMAAITVQTVVCCGMLAAAVWRGAFGRRSKGKLALAVLPLLLAAVYVTFLLLFDAGVRKTFAIAFNPSLDPRSEGYWGMIVRQMMFGSPEGQGPGLMFMQWNDAMTDWLFMTTKWTWGWPGAALMMGAEVLLLVWGFRIARKQTGLLARSVCMGVMVPFALQTFMYVLQNCGIILIASYGLPLLSYGGTYLCQTMLLLGLLLSAQRSGQLESGLMPEGAHPVP